MLRPARERFASYQCLFGQERLFTMELKSRRFPWGSAQLCLAVNRGVVMEAVLYTDSLKPELSGLAQQAVKGVPCRDESLREALFLAAKDHPALQAELASLGELFEQDAGKRGESPRPLSPVVWRCPTALILRITAYPFVPPAAAEPHRCARQPGQRPWPQPLPPCGQRPPAKYNWRTVPHRPPRRRWQWRLPFSSRH